MGASLIVSRVVEGKAVGTNFLLGTDVLRLVVAFGTGETGFSSTALREDWQVTFRCNYGTSKQRAKVLSLCH